MPVLWQGGLIYLEIKTSGRLDHHDHRVMGSRRGRNRGAGWDFVPVAVDDLSRRAFAGVPGDARKTTTTAFLLPALRWLRCHGIGAERVMTDNAGGYRSRRFAKVRRWLGIRHFFTRPYTPKTNARAGWFL